ncbi:MAG: putative Ig domain-containing protein [Synergistaceae bacterium]|nr:putative Ig domain-containing protein [Synergistaceae bacterium]
MRRKFFIALLCFMFVPIVCSQALGASAWYVTELTEGTSITYAQDDSTTEYNSSKWSTATADTSTKTFKDFFSNKVQADDIVYIKDGTFTITGSNMITIDKNVTVYGGFKDGDSGINSRTGTTTIKGESLSNVVIFITSGKTVTLDGLIITGGNGSSGGGVQNRGTLTMTNCTVSGNTASNGGGVYNEYQGTLTMTNCTIANNTSTGNYGGGGVFKDGGTLTMTNCTISGNKTTGSLGGGGVFNGKNNNGNGPLTMTNCTVANNTATNGGGVYNYSATLTMKNTFVWGDANNVIYNRNSGTITATYSAFPSGLSGITFDDTTHNIAISSWNTQTPKEVTVNGVTHTVYRIEDNSELSALEGKGTAEDAPEKDQIGHTRNNPPSIGAVEKVKVPVLSPETLTIDAIESKPITAQTITVTQGLDIILSTSGTLPDGLTTASTDTTFTISGTPAAGTVANSPYTYNVTASNDAGKTTTIVTVNVIIAPVLSCDKEITLTEGEAMTDFTITAKNKDTVTWSSSGTLPKGLTASDKDNTFTITGTPDSGTAADSPYTYTVTAENAAGKTDAQITITINAADNTDEGGSTTEPKSFKPVLSESEINNTYQEGDAIENIVINATSGDNLTWSASGTLPDGLTGAEADNGTSYTISGTIAMNNTEGSYTYTITAKNDAGEASSVVNITVEKFELNLDTLTEPEENQTLSKYLTETLGLSAEQLATLTEFKIPAKITDLNGIAELMPHLQTLDLTEAVSLGENLDLRVLGKLQLESVNLSGNTAIKTLNLKGCNIKNVNAEDCKGLVSVDVAGNEFIEELQLSSTDISEINASGCKNLKTLHFANAKVSKLDLTGCTEMRYLNFQNNRIRRFHKDHFGLNKLERLNAKNQRAYKSLLERIFDLAAFLLSYDNDSDVSTAGIVINSAVNSGDENLINVTGYDESGNAIEYDDSEYPETGKIIFDKAPATIIYNYDTGLTNNSMDVTVSGTPEEDDEEDYYLENSGGGCNSGIASGMLLALAGLALIRNKKH